MKEKTSLQGSKQYTAPPKTGPKGPRPDRDRDSEKSYNLAYEARPIWLHWPVTNNLVTKLRYASKKPLLNIRGPTTPLLHRLRHFPGSPPRASEEMSQSASQIIWMNNAPPGKLCVSCCPRRLDSRLSRSALLRLRPRPILRRSHPSQLLTSLVAILDSSLAVILCKVTVLL